MAQYQLKPGKIGKKVIGTYEKIEKGFVDAFLEKDEESGEVSLKTGAGAEAVVGAYKKIEDGVVGAYKKVENAFVDSFLEKVEDETPAAQAETESEPQGE